MGPDERNHYNITTALVAIGIAIAVMALAVTLALLSAGCRTCTITNHGGTINVQQNQVITPKTTATGIPMI